MYSNEKEEQCNVKVCMRCRPLNEKERNNGNQKVVSVSINLKPKF